MGRSRCCHVRGGRQVGRGRRSRLVLRLSAGVAALQLLNTAVIGRLTERVAVGGSSMVQIAPRWREMRQTSYGGQRRWRLGCGTARMPDGPQGSPITSRSHPGLRPPRLSRPAAAAGAQANAWLARTQHPSGKGGGTGGRACCMAGITTPDHSAHVCRGGQPLRSSHGCAHRPSRSGARRPPCRRAVNQALCHSDFS